MVHRVRRSVYNPNALTRKSEFLFNLLLVVIALSCVIPFLFVIVISLTDERVLIDNGYSFFPEKWSFSSYDYIFENGGLLLNSYFISIVITVVGTVLALILTSMYAYALFRKQYKLRGFFTGVAVFTMLFSGGLVPYYVTMTQFLFLEDSIWALILPGTLSAFNIIIFRTFYSTTVHDALIESAIIDGGGEFQIFTRIVMPLSLPGIATIGLFSAIGFWNEWFNALLFITDPKKVPIQYLLMKIQRQMDWIIKNNGRLGPMESSEALANIPHESARMVLVVLIVLPIACAYPFFQRYFVKGLTIGAIKG